MFLYFLSSVYTIKIAIPSIINDKNTKNLHINDKIKNFGKHKIHIDDCVFSSSFSAIYINSGFQENKKERISSANTTILIRNTLFETLMLINTDTMQGGAFYSTNCQVIFENCLFSDNYAAFGAACAIISSKVDFIETNFSRNRAEVAAGAAILSLTTSNFEKCNIKGCWSEEHDGALLMIDSSTWITHTVFLKCFAESSGCCSSKNSIIVSTSSYFTKNRCTVRLSGAAFEMLASNASIINCTFINNIAINENHPLSSDIDSIINVSTSCFDTDQTFFQNQTRVFFDSYSLFSTKCYFNDDQVLDFQEKVLVVMNARNSFLSNGFYISLSILSVVMISVGLLLLKLHRIRSI